MDLMSVVMSNPFPNIIKLQDVQSQSLFRKIVTNNCRLHWPRGLRRGSAAAPRFLEMRVPIALGAWMFVSSECCGLSCKGLCVWLITHPEESYRVWCVLSVIVKSQ